MTYYGILKEQTIGLANYFFVNRLKTIKNVKYYNFPQYYAKLCINISWKW